jgi:lipopolysaccharide export system protein LptA
LLTTKLKLGHCLVGILASVNSKSVIVTVILDNLLKAFFRIFFPNRASWPNSVCPMMSFSWLPKISRRWLAIAAIAPTVTITLLGTDWLMSTVSSGPLANAQPVEPKRPLTLRSDVQEANAKTGVITARGNVQIFYPARQIQATAAQAQYFSRERRIILSGDVYVLQQGNSLRGETITYLIDEGRFVALPLPPKQVEAVYLLQESPSPAPSPVAAPPPVAPPTDPFGQPEFTTPESSPLSPPTP